MTADAWLLRWDVLGAVLAMAAATYLCRIAGTVLRRAVQLPRFLEAMLRELPGPLFVAYVTPALAEAGVTGLLAAAAVMLTQWRTGQLALSIPMGVVALALLRLWPA
ncbi:AzlD family protein [Roseomonas elaeocarpi]|uniref:AzlD family protein n=1 Tax=Roseomonas elaeocarpi TaxID=907779 RepID=A0ABV6JT04_9PROT